MLNSEKTKKEHNQPDHAKITGDDGLANNKKRDEEKEIVIHSMPKNFLVQNPKAQKAKSMGILVLAGGAVILIIVLILLYFYLSNPRQNLLTERTEESISTSEVNKEETVLSETKSAELAVSDDKETVKPAINIINAEEKEIISTTTEAESVSTTTKIIMSEPGVSEPTDYQIAVDSDSDGLTDAEETLLGCDINSKDSDGDGYEDLMEILKLYNPAGAEILIVNKNIEKYTNFKYSYSLYYLRNWLVDEIGGDDSIIFKLDGNQFIQVIIQNNSAKQDIESWYKEQSGVNVINNSQWVYKKGWQGVKSEDGLIVYLTRSNSEYIFILSYNLGAGDTLYYKNIFDMVVASFEAQN